MIQWETIGKWWFNGILMGFHGDFNGINGTYPLVNYCNIAIENGHLELILPIEHGNFP